MCSDTSCPTTRALRNRNILPQLFQVPDRRRVRDRSQTVPASPSGNGKPQPSARSPASRPAEYWPAGAPPRTPPSCPPMSPWAPRNHTWSPPSDRASLRGHSHMHRLKHLARFIQRQRVKPVLDRVPKAMVVKGMALFRQPPQQRQSQAQRLHSIPDPDHLDLGVRMAMLRCKGLAPHPRPDWHSYKPVNLPNIALCRA